MTLFRSALLLGLAFVLTAQAPQPPAHAGADGDVLKATLDNGLRVVIVRNPLAPVVSTDLTYLVGSRDDPHGVPGMAHAQEHMMFRGTTELNTAQLGTIATALGGDFNAETSDTITQYQFTVPAADLDAVLRIESDRMHDVRDLQSEWQNERGAIEQEVLRDETEPGADFFTQAEAIANAGTPYGHHGVGTKAAFDKLTGPELKAFYDRWYAPNNAVLVVAGDVDPQRALAQIRARFDDVPRKPVPAHAVAHYEPIKRTVLVRPTTLIYPLATVGYRFPGISSPDFLPSFVLQGILGSPRGPIRALADDGTALEAEWDSEAYTPDSQLGFATAALRPGADPAFVAGKLEAVTRAYAEHGVPRELFESTKHQLIAEQEESRNSVTALAADWATTIALDGEPSISHEQQLIAAVTIDEVNRVAKRYLDPRHAIVGELTPSASASQSAAASPPQQGTEKPLQVQSAVTSLPPWGEALIRDVQVPASQLAPTTAKLSNGITLIVQPETISDSVFLFGSIKNNPDLEEPRGQEGISGILDGIFSEGTRSQDRIAQQRALDAADTELRAGTSFGFETTRASFNRAVDLLAENELQPRFDASTFAYARQRAVDELETSLNSANTLALRRAAPYLLPVGDPELREATPQELGGLTLDQVERYYATVIRPDLTTIVVVGNVSPDAVRAALEHAFADWHASGPAPAVDLPPLPRNGPGRVAVDIPVGQTDARYQEIVPVARGDAQSYPLLLGTAILGGGSLSPAQSRLFRDLRQDAGLVYTVDAQLSPRRDRYLFSIEFASLPNNEPRISSLIDDEIGRMQTQPVGDFELALAKASIVRQGVVEAASVGAIGGQLLDEGSTGLPFDQPQRDARAYLDTDAAAIEHAFATQIDPKAFVRIIEGPHAS
ncbi:MAG TPA: pitrilysin family protein [Candidatus Sulfotelmatobacter sp.]|nr:pitrilysin family protein [Candidatus Sulfotelmatobacter sp.]